MLRNEVVQGPETIDETHKFSIKEYDTEQQQLLKHFNFSNSDLTPEEFERLVKMILEYKDVYAKTKYDVGTIKTPFHIQLKSDAELRKQRPSKVPIHYQQKLYNLLDELAEHGIIQKVGKDVDTTHQLGSAFFNPIIIIPKGDTIKLVLDARTLDT